jgi:hypothetical protein
MKISVNIEFESLEEYLEFNKRLERPLTKAESNPLQPKTSMTVKLKPKPGNPDVHSVPGFKPSQEMLKKVQKYLELQKPFKTADVVSPSIMNNPNQRTKANQWLKAHPDLVYERVKQPGKGGKGPLIYSPIHYVDGKIILPSPIHFDKTDWPIKVATVKKQYVPFPELYSEELYSDETLSCLMSKEALPVREAKQVG